MAACDPSQAKEREMGKEERRDLGDRKLCQAKVRTSIFGSRGIT